YNFFFQAEDGIRDRNVTGVQTCALPISGRVAESLPVHLFPDTAGLSRRERTHHLLMQAGVSLLAEERTEVSVLEITRTAGVGQRSEERRVGKVGADLSGEEKRRKTSRIA